MIPTTWNMRNCWIGLVANSIQRNSQLMRSIADSHLSNAGGRKPEVVRNHIDLEIQHLRTPTESSHSFSVRNSKCRGRHNDALRLLLIVTKPPVERLSSACVLQSR